ncbi:xanthine dehydrogenase accessory protein XdhC [Stappia stellulata]|uniref:xanthine dehydrogenase accessory protein XdhC n=1 Tax=Stappia stellulata TaxID=71235 RepID=UPI0003F80710|nr:xanthine dehydrogenase accessory protein XdhC [Stappia stellulata]
MSVWASVLALLKDEPACALVTVVRIEGSAPREVGARMVVDAARRFSGTIGGGMLEYQAIEAAAAGLQNDPSDSLRLDRMSLGPDLGQCCGGRVTLAVETITRRRCDEVERLSRLEAQGTFVTQMTIPDAGVFPRRTLVDAGSSLPCGVDARLGDGRLSERFGIDRTPVCLFGAGHVGKALVLALAPLPFSLVWIDNRPDIFPSRAPATVRMVAAADPLPEANGRCKGAEVLIMTHDHALDLAIADVALRQPDVAGVGMIGSETKAARMRSRLVSAGHEPRRVAEVFRCPIGLSGLASKAPAAIATSVAAELLMRRERREPVHNKRRNSLAGSIAAI